jgi:hypothetical protein
LLVFMADVAEDLDLDLDLELEGLDQDEEELNDDLSAAEVSAKPMIVAIGAPFEVATAQVADEARLGPLHHFTLVFAFHGARLDVSVCAVPEETREGSERFHLLHHPREVAAAPDVADWILQRYPTMG